MSVGRGLEGGLGGLPSPVLTSLPQFSVLSSLPQKPNSKDQSSPVDMHIGGKCRKWKDCVFVLSKN